MQETLSRLGLPTAGSVTTDGSGLDLGNRVTCDLLAAALDELGADSSVAADLPVAGETGTLRKRMRGTAAQGKVRAKTGTLREVNALAGFVESASGEVLTFALHHQRQPAHRPHADRPGRRGPRRVRRGRVVGPAQPGVGLSPSRARTSGRRSGGTVLGGWRRAGRPDSSRSVMSATSSDAVRMASTSAAFGLVMPVTLRMYCVAAASISSRVAAGSRPLSSVMFRHMPAA